MDTDTKDLIETVLLKANNAARDWAESKIPDIEKIIHKKLDDRLVEIIAMLMGFQNRFGEFEVDYTNGRMGESAAGDWLRARARDAVTSWLDTQAGNLPALPKSAISSLKKVYHEELERQVEAALIEKARKDAVRLFEEICASYDDNTEQ